MFYYKADFYTVTKQTHKTLNVVCVHCKSKRHNTKAYKPARKKCVKMQKPQMTL